MSKLRINELESLSTGKSILVDEIDSGMRLDLANPDKGAAMVARGVVAVDSIADLLTLPEGQQKEGMLYLVGGFYQGKATGGGQFYFSEAGLKELHDGRNVIDPTAPPPIDYSTLPAYFEHAATGTGVFVRVATSRWHRTSEFGCLPDLSHSQYAVNRCAQVAGVGGYVKVDVEAKVSDSVYSLPSQRWDFEEEIRLADAAEPRLYLFMAEADTTVMGVKLDADFENNPIEPGSGRQAVLYLRRGATFFGGYLRNGGHNFILTGASDIVFEGVRMSRCGEHAVYLGAGAVKARNAIFRRCTFEAIGLSATHSEAFYLQCRNYDDIVLDECWGIDVSEAQIQIGGFNVSYHTADPDGRYSNNFRVKGGSYLVAGAPIAINGVGSNGFKVDGTVFKSISTSAAAGFRLRGQGGSFSRCEFHSLRLSGTNQIEFNDCKFFGVNSRFHIEGDVKFSKTKFYAPQDITAWVTGGLLVAKSGRLRIEDCFFDPVFGDFVAALPIVGIDSTGDPDTVVSVQGMEYNNARAATLRFPVGRNISVRGLVTDSNTGNLISFTSALQGYVVYAGNIAPAATVNLSAVSVPLVEYGNLGTVILPE